MWTKSILLLSLFFLIVACDKEISEWDKESNLPLDTTVVVYHGNYVSHSDTFLTLDFELVQFNGLSSETSYLSPNLSAYYADNFDMTFSNIAVENKIENSGYSTILLMESTSHSLFKVGKASLYFSRFFEQNQNLTPLKNIGLATFRSDEPVNLQFHKEKSGLYANSASFNDSIMYDLIRVSPETNFASSAATDFRDLMFTVMDTLRNNPATVGEKSITIVDDYVANNSMYYDDSFIKDIVDYANLYAIKINVICRCSTIFDKLALGTNGFIIDERIDNKIVGFQQVYFVTEIGTGIANLDALLSNKVTVFKYRVVLNNRGNFSFTSANSVSLQTTFGSDFFDFNLILP